MLYISCDYFITILFCVHVCIRRKVKLSFSAGSQTSWLRSWVPVARACPRSRTCCCLFLYGYLLIAGGRVEVGLSCGKALSLLIYGVIFEFFCVHVLLF